MTLGLPAVGAFDYLGLSRANSSMPATFAAFLEYVRGLWGLDEATFQISGAAVTPDRMRCIVDTNGLATANLDTIATTNLPIGFPLLLRSADPARVPKVRHARGTAAQILLSNGADYQIVSTTQRLMLVREAAGWVEQWRFDGTAQGTFRSYWGLSTAATYPAATQSQAIAGIDDLVAGPVLVTALRLRQVLTDRSWLAALSAFTGTLDQTKWVLHDDGTNPPWRLPIATLLAGTPRKGFVSGEQAIGNATSGQVAHGLGAQPSLLQGSLRCKTAEFGYTVGTEIPLTSIEQGGSTRYVQLYADNVNAGYLCVAQNSPAAAVKADGSGTIALLTAANWRLVIRAWL